MNPFGLPLTTLQNAIGGISPYGQQGFAAIPNHGAIAQQQQLQQLQQLALILASQGAIPQLYGQATPGQSPLQPNLSQNPLLAQQLALQAGSVYGQPQFVQPQYGQIGAPFGQQNALPFAQPGFAQAGFGQTGYPLAPQSWVGQQVPGQAIPFHLSQLAGRGLY